MTYRAVANMMGFKACQMESCCMIPHKSHYPQYNSYDYSNGTACVMEIRQFEEQ